MKNWKALANINDTKNKIAQIEYEMGDAKLVRDHHTVEYETEKADLLEKTRVVNSQFDNAMAKRSKVMALMSD